MNYPEWTYADAKREVANLAPGYEVNFTPAGDPECGVSIVRNGDETFTINIVRAASRIGATPEVYARGRETYAGLPEVIGAVGGLCLR